jgi:hypothetical protein
MDIGAPLRIIEVEPLWIPVPDAPLAPAEEPAWEPEPEPALAPP